MQFESYYDAVIYLVDDEPIILDSLAILLKTTRLKTVSYKSAEDFLNNYCPNQAGCLVLDLKMPIINGHELQHELSERNIRIPIIFISGNAKILDAANAFKGGAVDFLEKPFDPNQLIECILSAIKKDIENRKQQLEKEKTQELFNSLSIREKEILLLIVNNYSSKEAGKKLDISYRTVEAHRAHIMEKMQIKSVTELVATILKYSLV